MVAPTPGSTPAARSRRPGATIARRVGARVRRGLGRVRGDPGAFDAGSCAAAMAAARPGPAGSSRDQAATAQHDRGVEQRFDPRRVVRRQQDDRAAVAQRREPRQEQLRGHLVEAGERLVEQDDARPRDQRALEADPLPHAAREAADGIAGAIAQPRPVERLGDARLGIGDAVQRGEEAQVLGRGQLRVEPGIVAQPADAPAHRRGRRTGALAVHDPAARRTGAPGREPQERGLAGAVRSEDAGEAAGAAGEGDPRQDARAPVVDGHGVERQAIRIARRTARLDHERAGAVPSSSARARPNTTPASTMSPASDSARRTGQRGRAGMPVIVTASGVAGWMAAVDTMT